eukprot:3236420-Pyramimonas_sp.AAC.1
MRLAAARSLSRDKSGAFMSFRLRSHPSGARVDPYAVYHMNVVLQWCKAIWDGSPGLDVMQLLLFSF